MAGLDYLIESKRREASSNACKAWRGWQRTINKTKEPERRKPTYCIVTDITPVGNEHFIRVDIMGKNIQAILSGALNVGKMINVGDVIGIYGKPLISKKGNDHGILITAIDLTLGALDPLQS